MVRGTLRSMLHRLNSTTIAPLASNHPKGWSQAQAELVTLLMDFALYWVPALLFLTLFLALHTRRRPGRLLTAGPLRRSRTVRKRIERLRESLREDGIHDGIQTEALNIRITAMRRWQVMRLWLFGSAILPSGIVVFGTLGGWGGRALPQAAAFGAFALLLSTGAAAAEVWSLRRADPYGDALQRGFIALEALTPRHCMESRVGNMWRALGDRRPGAYAPVDWTFRTAEEFCASLNRLACHAVRSRDQVARSRREHEVRLFIRHMQEALERYRTAANTCAQAEAASHAQAAEANDARKFLQSSLANVLGHLCQGRLILPTLSWDDLPDDRRAAEDAQVRRQTMWHATGAVFALSALAVLFAWLGVPGEFTSPVVIALGGLASVLLPRARWPIC